jgi:glycosyltransferase involved in cell wall biosynthesis
MRFALRDSADFRLAIAAPTSIPFSPFQENGTLYYGVLEPPPHTPITKIARAWAQSLFSPSNDVQQCLWIVKHFEPDLIHVHGTENTFGLLKKYLDVPLVVSLQGLLTIYYRFYFHGLNFKEVARMLLSRHFLAGNNEIHGYMRCGRFAEREREIVRINDFFIGRTDWDREFVELLNPRAKYFHCDELLRPQFSKSFWNQENSQRYLIYCTGSNMIFKGVESLIEALGLLHASGLKQIRLRISGVPYYGDVMNFYRRKELQHKVESSIDWLGRLNAQQIIEECLNAEVFCYPSHIDNSPNALCEAMSLGVPCIASHVGGIPSLLTHKKEGLLFPDGDAYALAGKIKYMLENPMLAKEMGEAARNRALSRHRIETVCSNLLSIYYSLL